MSTQPKRLMPGIISHLTFSRHKLSESVVHIENTPTAIEVLEVANGLRDITDLEYLTFVDDSFTAPFTLTKLVGSLEEMSKLSELHVQAMNSVHRGHNAESTLKNTDRVRRATLDSLVGMGMLSSNHIEGSRELAYFLTAKGLETVNGKM